MVSLTRGLPRSHGRWLWFCLAVIALNLVAHAVYLVPFALPDAFIEVWGSATFASFFLFFVTGTLAPLVVFLGLVPIAALAPLRPRWFFVTHTGADGASRHAVRPWLSSAAWTALFAMQLTLDISPFLTAVAVSSAALLVPGSIRSLPASRARWLVFAGLVATWSLLARDEADLVGIAVWSTYLAGVLAAAAPRLAARDCLALCLGGMALAQIAAAAAPMLADWHGGTRMGGGMAYSFCEHDGKLYAAVPRCSPNAIEDCVWRSTVEVYDLESLSPIASYRFFSEDFYGRIEQITCFDDLIEIGLDAAVIDGEALTMSLMTFRRGEPQHFTPDALGDRAGHRATYDPRRNASFYASEDSFAMRRDRDTGEITRAPASLYERDGLNPQDIGFHERRDGLFAMATIRKLYELDPDTLALRSAHSISHGWEFTIDEDLDRIYIAGNHGLEVFDVAQGRVVRRLPLGFVGRRPLLDAARGLLYVPSTGGGRIQVFDRESLDLLGTLPLGSGIRYLYLSRDGRRIFGSSALAHYWWDADALARRFRHP